MFALRNDQCPMLRVVVACTTGDMFIKPAVGTRRAGVRIDVWRLRAMSIAVEAFTPDVPDNRPLSGREARGRTPPHCSASSSRSWPSWVARAAFALADRRLTLTGS
jgi:hypothetical protein